MFAPALHSTPAPATAVQGRRIRFRAVRGLVLLGVLLAGGVAQGKPPLKFTVLTTSTEPASVASPAQSSVLTTPYLLLGGAYHDTEWRRPENDLVAADLDPLVHQALAAAGLPRATGAKPPEIAIFYHWGAHLLPDARSNEVNTSLLRQNVLERAALAGGKTFANELKVALQDANDVAETNSQGFRGYGGQAAVGVARAMSAYDPLEKFRTQSERHQHLVDQAMHDCYFVIISAFEYDPATQERGTLLWRTNATIGAEKMKMKPALVHLLGVCGPYLGRPMAEAATFRQPAR